ncbi:MAG: hypothetical protein J6C06_07135 [Lachnospiraceae bacterium]|nr:hypothetical protein [Lachnospiraceae bacterium]
MKKTLLLYPTIFISTVLICLLFLLATAMIPQDAVSANALKSAKYFHNEALFENKVGKFENFKIDNYADCISTGIAWHLGEGGNYRAVISADYNSLLVENVNESFYWEMQGEEVETENYSRYWHGSAGVIRLMLLFTDIKIIRYIIAGLGILLNLALVTVLIRKKQVVLGVAYMVAFLLVNGVFALTCMEYAFIFLLVPAATIILIQCKKMQQRQNAQAAFLAIGMLTAYFDFLTTETLTFTVPFAMYYLVVKESKEQQTERKVQRKKDWFFLFKSGICWCAGYVGMFLAKWGLSAVTLGKDIFLDSASHAMERVSGDVNLTLNGMVEKANFGERLQGIFQRNLGCLYWNSQDVKAGTVVIITLVAVAVLGSFWYMARKENYEYDKAVLLCVVALIPFLRFLVLSNHAYIHYFFTYRALLVMVMVLIYLIYETTFLSNIKGKNRRRKNGKKN